MRTPEFFNIVFDRLELDTGVRTYLIDELTSPHRHYHGLAHISSMINWIDGPIIEWRRQEFQYPEVILAALFHDIVYDPTKSDNEAMSVVEMKLRLDGRKYDLEHIEKLIMLTVHHELTPEHYFITSAEMFVCADLEILWSDNPVRYSWYATGIRKEYSHVSNEAYRIGRSKVLDNLKMLDIIQNPEFIYQQVVKNIEWEKDYLNRGLLDV